LLSALLILITYSFLRTTIPPEADGRVHLTNRKQDYPVESLIPLPTAKSPKNNLPPIQARPRPETAAQKSLRLERQAAVREAFLHSWTGYKNNAWLHDEVRPVAGGYKDKFGGWAATLVDSLDSLYILDLHEEFELAVNAIKKIDFSTTDQVVINVFETIIRYLGGFLGAYDVSGGRYPVLLEKAVEVGELVMGAFDTPNRMPISRWNWDS
jgi:mannosyl-oligosaccharide alpha-1,2-mannosidase